MGLFYRPYFDVYIHASPRYNAVKNFLVDGNTKVAEDYARYDTLNGTADKFFPCYSLTDCSNSSNTVTTFLIDELGMPGVGDNINREQPSIRGSFTYSPIYTSEGMLKSTVKTIGKKVYTKSSPVNSNLAKVESEGMYYNALKSNPGWCIIQSIPVQKEGSNPPQITEMPIYFIRPLGNNDSIKMLYARNMGTKILKRETTGDKFEEGELISYLDRIFRCKSPTNTLPVIQTYKNTFVPNDYWEELNFADNVFHADVFAFVDGKLIFFKMAEDPVRKFNPNLNKDPKTGQNPNSNLVCWAVGYYQ